MRTAVGPVEDLLKRITARKTKAPLSTPVATAASES
jgi:hypothetical protein